MRIGFCGSHRSGKTTLAKLVASQREIQFVESPASEIVKRYGFDMGRDNRLTFEPIRNGVMECGVDMRLEIYDELAERCLNAGEHFVSDRTPIDVAAYLIADATGYAGHAWRQEQAVAIVEKAIVDTQRLYDIVIFVPPLPDYMEEQGKPPLNRAYQEHHSLICRGILFDEDLDVYWDGIRRDTFSLTERMKFVNGMIDEWLSTTQIPAAKVKAA